MQDIASGCMGATRTQQDWEPLWRTGHCLLGSLTASTGEWRDSKNNVIKPARQLFCPRPIPPSFSVLARACSSLLLVFGCSNVAC